MLTKEKLFDLIAPIFIYFFADLCYENEAIESLEKLKTLRHDATIKRYFDNDDLDKNSIDDIDHYKIKDIYDELFEEMVLSVFPDAVPDYDRSGAKCFTINGRKYLNGDAYLCYPFYADHQALKIRLSDLHDELYNELYP